MTIKSYDFSISVTVNDGEVIDSWGYCDGDPFNRLLESIDYSKFEEIALDKYEEEFMDAIADAADRKRER